MRFFKWLYIEIWLPVNFYFGVFFSQLAQFKIVMEIMVFLGAGYLYFTDKKFTNHQLLFLSIGFFLIGSFIGLWLTKAGVLRKGNTLGNAQNKELMEILERIKKIEEKI